MLSRLCFAPDHRQLVKVCECTDYRFSSSAGPHNRPIIIEDAHMSLGLILVILLVIFLLGGFSGRFGGYGYGYGHGGVSVIGIVLIILLILLFTGRI